MNFNEARKQSGVTAATAAAEGLWPEAGLAIYGDDPDVGIICHGDRGDIRDAEFTSWTYSRFHYCPTAKWKSWVALAKRILEIDAIANSSGHRESK